MTSTLRAGREQHAHGHVGGGGHACAQHRHERHDAATARDQEQRATQARLPDEVAADRAAQLDLIARTQLVGQVRRDLAVVEALDRQLHPVAIGGCRDGVTALRLIAVLRRQPDVDVLAGQVSLPARAVKCDRAHAGRPVGHRDDVAEQPGQSPA